jgi:signal peptidase
MLNNDSPIVSVLSESMEPGFKRGDILFLKPHEYKTGDILVYQVRENDIPIVHRVIKITNGIQLLTKGDNNRLDDVGLYRKGRTYLLPEETRSTVFGYIPFFGMITIWISSVPGLKFLIMATSAWMVFSTRDDGASFL